MLGLGAWQSFHEGIGNHIFGRTLVNNNLAGFYYITVTCPQSWGCSPHVPSFPTALPVSIQSSLLCYLFTMPSQCSPLKSFVPGASLSSLEPPGLPWSLLDVHGASWTSMEFPRLSWSSSYLAGVAAIALEFLLLPWSSLPLEFFGDPLQGFPCLPKAFLISPVTWLLCHHFAVS